MKAILSILIFTLCSSLFLNTSFATSAPKSNVVIITTSVTVTTPLNTSTPVPTPTLTIQPSNTPIVRPTSSPTGKVEGISTSRNEQNNLPMNNIMITTALLIEGMIVGVILVGFAVYAIGKRRP